ncbi:MAG: hypothetical protein ABIN97_21380 [Ginsengibacter sp.]
MKRNIINEIELKRVRSNKFKSIVHDLKEFEQTIHKANVTSSYDLFPFQLIPVNICSAFETFFKEQITLLIDQNHVGITRVEMLDEVKLFKPDLSFIHKVISQKISLGELVSHLVSIKKIERINNVFSVLINTDFLNSLKHLKTSFTYDAHLSLMNWWRRNYNEIIKDIDSLYRLRNIICHEHDAVISISKDTLLRYLKNSIVFLEITSIYLDSLIAPIKSKRKKVSELTLAKREFIKLENELGNLADKICDYSNKVRYDTAYLIINLRDEMVLWKQHRKKIAKSNCELYCTQRASYCSMYWFNMQIITDEKIKTLKDRHEDLFAEVESYSKLQTFN